MSTIEKLGKFVIRGTLGKGAMGLVYRAWDPFLEREVALKTMMDQVSLADPTAKERFFREGKSAAKLKHANIVTIYELGEEQDVPYIAMEIIDGQPLSSWMKKGELSLEQKLTIVKGVAEGLDFAHRGGVVHRDIKPANIAVNILKDDAGRETIIPKIMDFGIAKLSANDMTKTGMILGTINYMSPEQLKADKSLDGRSDLFAVGVILYELLIGKKPFTGDTITAVMYKIVHDQPEDLTAIAQKYPAPVVSLVKKALAKDRNQRYQTGKELADDSQKVIDALRRGNIDQLSLEQAQGEATAAVDSAAAGAAMSATQMTGAATAVHGQQTVGGATSQSVGGRTAMTGQTRMQGGTGAMGAAGTMGGTNPTVAPGTQATMTPGMMGGTQATMAGGGMTMATMQAGPGFGAQPPKSKLPLILGAAALLAVGGGFAAWKTMNKPALPGTVSVLADPWGEITALKDGKGKDVVPGADAGAADCKVGEQTPCTAKLPPGDYTLTLAVGPEKTAAEFKFTIRPGQLTLARPAGAPSAGLEKSYLELLSGSAPAAP